MCGCVELYFWLYADAQVLCDGIQKWVGKYNISFSFGYYMENHCKSLIYLYKPFLQFIWFSW